MTTRVKSRKQMKATMIGINNEYDSDAIESEGEDDSNLKSLHPLLQTRKMLMSDRLQHAQDER